MAKGGVEGRFAKSMQIVSIMQWICLKCIFLLCTRMLQKVLGLRTRFAQPVPHNERDAEVNGCVANTAHLQKEIRCLHSQQYTNVRPFLKP